MCEYLHLWREEEEAVQEEVAVNPQETLEPVPTKKKPKMRGKGKKKTKTKLDENAVQYLGDKVRSWPSLQSRCG